MTQINKENNKSIKPRKENDQWAIVGPDYAPYGFNDDGTPFAPYDLKKDGTPKLRRGRSKGQGAQQRRSTDSSLRGLWMEAVQQHTNAALDLDGRREAYADALVHDLGSRLSRNEICSALEDTELRIIKSNNL